MEDCIFCKIVRGELPSYKVYEDSDILVILDKFPASRGHLLVIPRGHHAGVEDTPPRTLARAWLAASALARVYRKSLGAKGVNIVTNSGRPAGQVIFHFHIHVIPRWSDQPDPQPYKPKGELGDKEAREVLEMLKPHAAATIREYLED